MNNLCTDIGYRSLNKYGEQLCGDHIDMVESEEDTIIVLADGLGSGVKANILSTLTAKIISTMMSEGMSIEDCVATIAATLPVCSERQVAYSTFTIIRIRSGEEAEIIQYDNPRMIFLRGGKNYDYPVETMTIGGKSICRSKLCLCDGDLLIAVSDGALHAGVGRELNFGWERSNIIDFMETLADGGFTAKCTVTVTDPSKPALAEDGYYEISNAAQLKWFTDEVNASKDNAALNARLTDDIDLSGICSSANPWTPIGDHANNRIYSGTFDGQGHKITGLYLKGNASNYTNGNTYYIGLFGECDGVTIKNLSVYGTAMAVTRMVGGLAVFHIYLAQKLL